MFVSTTELISATLHYMIQPFALLCMLLIVTVYAQSTSRLRTIGLTYIAGVGLAYVSQLAYGAVSHGLLDDFRAYLTIFIALAIALLCLMKVQAYMMHKHVSLPVELTRLARRITQIASITIPLWLMLLFGFLVGMVEPIFYGQQQQLLTYELQLNISFSAIMLMLIAVAVALAPLLATLLTTTKLVPYIHRRDINTDSKQALTLISATGLIITSWLLALAAYSFI